MGIIHIASPAATDEASEALLEDGQSADADAAAAAASATAAAASATAAAATVVAPPTSLPIAAPATTSTDLDLFGGQSAIRIGCRPRYKT